MVAVAQGDNHAAMMRRRWADPVSRLKLVAANRVNAAKGRESQARKRGAA
jgi:hypothetical protein